MAPLLIYGSEDCPGWEDLREIVDHLRSDPGFGVPIEIRDPLEHPEEFRRKGLVICPSFLYRGTLIAVGIPGVEQLRRRVHDLQPS